MSTDPANARAKARACLGLTRELQQFRTLNAPDPSVGGSSGYPLWLRQKALITYNQTGSVGLAAIRAGCSHQSIYRWINRPVPFRQTGGSERKTITGFDMLLLSMCLFIWPDSKADDICAFIANNGGDIYMREDISQRCKELEISRKRASKEAYDAFSPTSLMKLRWFVTLPAPLGVHGANLWELIDVDETGFYLKSVTPNYGRAHTSCRVRFPAHYTRKEPKINVIFGIEPGNPNLPPHVDGSVERPRRWYHISQVNCDQYVFGDFIDSMLTDIEQNPVPGNYDDRRIIMWDNLSCHKTPYVSQIIYGRVSNNVFQSVDRPPYRPKMAPIEYAFCELACALKTRVKREWTADDLRRNIEDICITMGYQGKFQNTFRHCGYPF